MSYRRKLGIPRPVSGLHVDPMIKKSTVLGHRLPEKLQRCKHAISGIGVRNISALRRDTDSRQTESGGGDTRDNGLIGLSYITSILDKTRSRIALFPKELEVGFFQVIQELIVFLGKLETCGRLPQA